MSYQSLSSAARNAGSTRQNSPSFSSVHGEDAFNDRSSVVFPSFRSELYYSTKKSARLEFVSFCLQLLLQSITSSTTGYISLYISSITIGNRYQKRVSVCQVLNFAVREYHKLILYARFFIFIPRFL